MEELRSSEKSIAIYQSTRRNIPHELNRGRYWASRFEAKH